MDIAICSGLADLRPRQRGDLAILEVAHEFRAVTSSRRGGQHRAGL